MTLKIFVAVLACYAAQVLAYSAVQAPSPTRNTIFGDEKLEGEVFENVDAFSNIRLYRDTDNPYRLPRTTKPTHYDLFWHINTNTRTYSGSVQINLVATQAGVNEIIIHSYHTTLSNIKLTKGNQNIDITYRLEDPYDFLRVRPSVDLEYDATTPVVYTLSIDFAGDMRTSMNGIYETWFRNNQSDTTVRWMSATHFQATAARFAFPCYDEPGFKATFAITVRRPSTHRSWTTTRIDRTVENTTAGFDDDIFLTTPEMSTYLLSLIVAEYESIELRRPDGQLTFEVVARAAAINTGQGDYAFNVGQDLLNEMNNHTDFNFYDVNPNLKMTHAALPDFSAGAMENWGLLVYREAYLMYDEEHTNSQSKQLIAYILSHEIAHMWFGNLVTCDWWDVFWLNEGFARYYQYFLTHWVETEMGFETRFVVEQVHTALLSDSANNPHPLSHSGIGDPVAIRTMFSTLSYNKGASIIRQAEHLLGFKVHRQGLRDYLRQRSFQTATPLHLFQALENAGVQQGALTEYGTNFDFIEYYKSWTDQPGHPVLNVHVNHATGDMTITQRRFNINTGYSSVANKYIVPITFATQSNPDFNNTKPTHILFDTVSVINRGSIGDEWVIFNIQQTGFYRVNYDDYTWDLIALALRSNNRTVIHEYNKAQIVNDVCNFARSGLMEYKRAFDILSFLQYETAYAPWLAALTGFSWIRNRLARTNELIPLNNLITQWANTVMTELTYYPIPNESFMRSYLRYQLAPVMCEIGVTACREAATAQFLNLFNSNVEVPVDSRNWVYCNALRDGPTTYFDFLWNRFLNHNVYTEKLLLLQTLGCTPHASTLETFMNAIIQDNFIIRPQDYTTAFNGAVTGNEGNTQIAFAFAQNNLDQIIKAFGTATTPLSYISSRLRTQAEVNSFQAWAIENSKTLAENFTAVYNGAAASAQSIQWAVNVAPDMNDYFVNGGDDLKTTTTATVTTQEVTTLSPNNLQEPVTPSLPDSAVTSVISSMLVAFALVAHFAL